LNDPSAKQAPGETISSVEYIANLEALHRIGVYFSKELERLGSNASQPAAHATDVIKLELDLVRPTHRRAPSARSTR